MGIKKHFHINSIILSLPLKQILGATLKGHVYILGRGGGYSPIKKTGVLVVLGTCPWNKILVHFTGLDVATCGVANATSFYSVVTKIFMPGRQPGPQDRWLSSLGKRKLMIICYLLQNKWISNGFSNALTFCPNALTVRPNPLTICLNALPISANTLTKCSYDLTVGLSNVWFLLERG